MEKVQIAKDLEGNQVLAEEFIPLNEFELQQEKDSLSVYEQKNLLLYENTLHQINTALKKERLNQLKQYLIFYSFQMQDIISQRNPYLNQEDIFKEKERVTRKQNLTRKNNK